MSIVLSGDGVESDSFGPQSQKIAYNLLKPFSMIILKLLLIVFV